MYLNRHKIARRWGRFKHRRSGASFYGKYESHHLDFALDDKKRNPYYARKRGMSRRFLLYLAILVFAGFGTALTLLFHPFFSVQPSGIEATGLQRIKKDELVDTTMGIVQHRWFGIIPRNSYAFLDTDEIGGILRERFPIQSISIEKIFPHTLRISVEESLSTIIYDNGTRYALIGADGRVVELLRPVGEDEWHIEAVNASSSANGDMVATSTMKHPNNHRPPVETIQKEFGEYPILYDTRGKGVALNDGVVSEKVAKGFLDWYALLERQTTIPILYAIIEHDLGDAVIKTGEEWEIRVRLNEDIQAQFEKLQTILREQKNRSALQYIDIRFRDRVFWQ